VRKVAAIVLFLAILLIGIDCATYTGLNPPSGENFNKGANGIWLRYLWYFGKKTDAEKEALVKRLGESQMRYAFFHVRSTDKNGHLLFKHGETGKQLTDLMHERLPDTKVIAWLYIPSNAGRRGVDPSNETTRKNLVEASKWLIDVCGFDGVQLDYEFFPDNDTMFPTLLDETRTAIGGDKFLSVATPMWYPFTLWGWRADHFTDVAKHCDQIAVMGYDSFLYEPRAYVWLMEQQVKHVTAAVSKASSNCKVLLGVPVYDTDSGTPGHLTFSENLSTALKGVKQGLRSQDAVPGVFEGIAPFAEYTMDDNEWSIYRKFWLMDGQSVPAPAAKP